MTVLNILILKSQIESELKCTIDGSKEIAFFNWVMESFDTIHRKEMKSHDLYKNTLNHINRKNIHGGDPLKFEISYHIFSTRVFYLKII
jgi:hypothetical protein|tara:strand:+ start:60812 stop:61078 length:267 start_codon:yes stop_codon:yes gene_type:complete